MKTLITCSLLVFLLLQHSSQAEAKTLTPSCKHLIKEAMVNQFNLAQAFKSNQSTFVVFVCKKEKQPIYAVLQARMYSPEVLMKTTPVVSLSNLKQAVNPNGSSNTTGILAASRDNHNQFTLNLRTRFASGEAIDIKKQAELKIGESMTFKFEGIDVGLLRLPIIGSQ